MYASQKMEESFANDNYIILVESVSLNSYFYIHFILSHVCGMCSYYACVCVCMPVHVVVCVFMGKCVIMNMWGHGATNSVGFLFHRFERESLSWFHAAYFSLAGLQASGFSLSAFYLTVWIWDCRYGLLCLALCGFWEFEPTSSCLESKNFSH